MNESTTSIDDLPAEMISELFSYLNPSDLLACSLVNKRWHSIFGDFKLDRLVATDNSVSCIAQWYDLNRMIRAEELCRLELFARLLGKPLLSNLKQFILRSKWLRFDLNELNELSQLVHLEIKFDFLDAKQVHLDLPKLSVLVIHKFNYHCPLLIGCPELRVLAYRGERVEQRLLVLEHPETIRRLETDMFGAKLTPFTGVECLLTQELQAISRHTLLSLPSLRELHYSAGIRWVFWKSPNESDDSRVKRTLAEFTNDVHELRSGDFLFRFAGFQLADRTSVDAIDFGVQVEAGKAEAYNEYVYMKNYQLIDPTALHFIRELNYTRLVNNVPGEIPLCFFEKFARVSVLYVTDAIEDADHFLWFLKSLRSLRKLELEHPRLPQEAYDQLPAVAGSLVKFVLQGDEATDLQVNFDFVGKLSQLSRLKICPVLSLKSTCSLLKWLDRLEEGFLNFRFKEKKFYIQKRRGSKQIQVCSFLRSLFKTENPDAICGFFKTL